MCLGKVFICLCLFRKGIYLSRCVLERYLFVYVCLGKLFICLCVLCFFVVTGELFEGFICILLIHSLINIKQGRCPRALQLLEKTGMLLEGTNTVPEVCPFSCALFPIPYLHFT